MEKFNSYGANRVLPETAPTAALSTRTITLVEPAKPTLSTLNVIVSRSGDQLKLPSTGGLMLKPDWTLFVFIGSLNLKTTGDNVWIPVALWGG